MDHTGPFSSPCRFILHLSPLPSDPFSTDASWSNFVRCRDQAVFNYAADIREEYAAVHPGSLRKSDKENNNTSGRTSLPPQKISLVSPLSTRTV